MARKKSAPASSQPRLLEVAMPGAPIRLVWADPGSLDENPKNWKVHPESQTQVVGDLISRHGWIKPLVYNEATGRLLDGHDRRKLSVQRGYPAVPVIVGTWPEESEAEILLTLDPSGDLAQGDPAAMDRLMRELGASTEALEQLIADLAEKEGVTEYLQRANASRAIGAKGGGGGGEPRESNADPAQPPEEFKSYDETLQTDYCCPKCGYAWSGQPR